jgi:hypothetical protein
MERASSGGEEPIYGNRDAAYTTWLGTRRRFQRQHGGIFADRAGCISVARRCQWKRLCVTGLACSLGRPLHVRSTSDSRKGLVAIHALPIAGTAAMV